MDGFAMCSGDTLEATEDCPVRLRVSGVVYAGGVFGRGLLPGEAVRIMTGAAMPCGADCMLPKEIIVEDGDHILVPRPARPQENYIFRGEDIAAGVPFLVPGTRLESAHLAMLAATGLGRVDVCRLPEIGLFCVGDEFSAADRPLGPGMIYNSNGIMLWARLTELGLTPRSAIILNDDPYAAASKIAAVADELDVIITTGSVSVGDKDIMGSVFERLEIEPEISRLAFKPGTAFLAGRYQAKLDNPCSQANGAKWFFCLSGNPFAALATLELVVRPVLARLANSPQLLPRRGRAVLGASFVKSGKNKGHSNQRRFLRGRLVEAHDGDSASARVILPDDHSSGRIFSLAGCNCLVDVGATISELSEGSEVDVVRLDIPVV
jgi:molybdopterin molybdotransferase